MKKNIVTGNRWEGEDAEPLRFNDLTFENNIYTDVVIQNAVYTNCHFLKCEFKNSRIGNNVTYVDCTWERCKIWGKYGGMGSEKLGYYESCKFVNTLIQNMNAFFGTRFTRCKFSGNFKNCIMNGGLKYPSASFVDCDLGDVIFENTSVRGAIDLQTCTLPSENLKVYNNTDNLLIEDIEKLVKRAAPDDRYTLDLLCDIKEYNQHYLILDYKLVKTLFGDERSLKDFENIAHKYIV